MEKYRITDFIAGFVVLVITALFANLIFKVLVGGSAFDKNSFYVLQATFDDSSGIEVGSNVVVSGVKIGKVSMVRLDPKTYRSNVEMSINSNYKIPYDSSITVATTGLLGSSYLRVKIGIDDSNFAEGEVINLTKSAFNLEKIVSLFVKKQLSK